MLPYSIFTNKQEAFDYITVLLESGYTVKAEKVNGEWRVYKP